MASSSTEEHSFIQHELDDVSLTEDEIKDLNENYIFLNFGESDTESSASDASPPLPASPLKQSEIEEKALPAEFRRISLRHRDEPSVPLPLDSLAQNFASSWNGKKSESVYKAFKVSSYIVDPNYILCISKSGKAPTLDNTVNYLLGVVGDPNEYSKVSPLCGPLRFPRWVDIKDNLLDVLDIYDGCECIPNVLNEPVTATQFISSLKTEIADKFYRVGGNVQIENAKRNFLSELKGLCSQLLKHYNSLSNKANTSDSYTSDADTSDADTSSIEAFDTDTVNAELKETNRISEPLFENYIRHLIQFFTGITSIPLTSRAKSRLPLKLSSRTRKRPTLMVEPDFQISLLSEVILVGEVKTFGTSPLSYLTHKGHRVKDEKSSQSACQGNMQEEEEQRRKTYCHTEMANSQSKGAGDQLLSRPAVKSPRHSQRHYRDLETAERYKMRVILPQLIAEMLACRSASKKFFDIGRPKENIQMGFTMEGFKLRFVRMVLNDEKDKKLPTVKDLISDQRIMCDMFLTKEFNLFKKSHIIMFFQILLALSFFCEARLRPK